MPYSTFVDLTNDIPQETIIQLTNDEERLPLSEENEKGYDLEDEDDPIVKRINKAIEDADKEIDSYLDGNYEVPLSPVPKRINKLSRTIAKYNLFSRRTLEMPDNLLSQYRIAIKDLEKIQQGVIDIGITKAGSDVSPSTYRTNKTTEDRIFSKAALRGL